MLLWNNYHFKNVYLKENIFDFFLSAKKSLSWRFEHQILLNFSNRSVSIVCSFFSTLHIFFPNKKQNKRMKDIQIFSSFQFFINEVDTLMFIKYSRLYIEPCCIYLRAFMHANYITNVLKCCSSIKNRQLESFNNDINATTV